MDAAAVGNKPFKGDENYNDMKKILEGLNKVNQQPTKQVINESASMNISMTADDASQVGELMALMRNAGMNPQPVGNAFIDNPNIPGRDDVPGDQDLKAGALGSAVGAGLGAMAGGPLGAAVGGGIGSALTSDDHDDPNIPGKDDVPGDQDLQAGMGGSLAGGLLGGAAGQVAGAGASQALGAAGTALGTAVGGPVGGAIGGAAGRAIPALAGSVVGSKIGDKLTGEDQKELNSIRKNAGLDIKEAGEDTATSVAQELKKMGASSNAHEDEIIKMIPDALKSLGLEGVLKQMNMSKGYQQDMLSDILDAVRSMGEAVVGGNAKPEDSDSVFARLMGDISEIQNGAMDDNDMADDIADELGDYLRNGDAPEDSHYAKAIGIVMDAIHDGPQAQADAAEEAISFLHSAEEEARGNNEDYANEPDEDYRPASDMIRGGNDINKSKKSYPPVAGGDNPMAIKDKIKEELSALYKQFQNK